MQMSRQDLSRWWVVIDDEHQWPAQVGRCDLSGRCVDRQTQGERASFPTLTFDADLAAMQLREVSCEDQAESGSLLLRSGARIQPLELFEQLPQVLLLYPDPGVADGYLRPGLDLAAANLHLTPFGSELDCVGDQVQQHLPYL